MIKSHQTQIIKIGNSNGVRIPKEFLQSFLTKNIVIEQVNDSLVISPVQSKITPRSKWNAILSKMKIENDEDFADFDTTLNDGLDEL
jgi:antitoxin MazE